MTRSDVGWQIACRIRQARLDRPAMTAKHVADYLGVTVEQYHLLEDGEGRATGEQIMLLADLMDLEPSWFFEGVRPPR